MQQDIPPTTLTPVDAALDQPMDIDKLRADNSLLDAEASQAYAVANRNVKQHTNRRRFSIGASISVLIVAGILAIMVSARPDNSLKTGDFAVISLPLNTILSGSSGNTNASSLSINGQLRVSSTLQLSPSGKPVAAKAGQMYYDQAVNQLYYYNGTIFVGVGGSNSVQNTTNLGDINNNVVNVISNIVSGGSGGLDSTGGIAGSVAKFTGNQLLGNSIISDDGINASVAGSVNLISPSTGIVPEYTAWPSNPVPIRSDAQDVQSNSNGVELGMKFRTDYNGQVRGMRFYKDATNVNTHVGTLWSSGGARLATATFTNETSSGWQQVRFSNPVTIAADTTYIVSYFEQQAPDGALHYSADANYFTNGGADNGPLHVLQDGVDGGNGVFNYNPTSTFPSKTVVAANYWVDVIYSPINLPAQYQIDGAQLSSLNLSNNNDLAKRSAGQVFSGTNTFRTAVNGVGFQIQSSSTAPIFRADTAALQLIIGNSSGSNNPVLLFLANKNTPDDPAGAAGATYYNSTLDSFRCFHGRYWYNCADLEVQHSFTQYDEFLGGSSGSFSGQIGTLGWNALAIGANGSLAFNPSTPAPDADRPGVLHLQTPAAANQGTILLLGGASGSMIVAKDNDVKVAVAVGSSSGQVMRVGLHNQTSGTARPLSGIWWEADTSLNTNWLYCYGTGAAAICAPSTVAVTADNWVTLQIRVGSTVPALSTATFVIGNNAYTIASAGTTIDTTNRVSPAMSCFSVVASAQDCYWDYFQLTGTTSVTR